MYHKNDNNDYLFKYTNFIGSNYPNISNENDLTFMRVFNSISEASAVAEKLINLLSTNDKQRSEEIQKLLYCFCVSSDSGKLLCAVKCKGKDDNISDYQLVVINNKNIFSFILHTNFNYIILQGYTSDISSCLLYFHFPLAIKSDKSYYYDFNFSSNTLASENCPTNYFNVNPSSNVLCFSAPFFDFHRNVHYMIFQKSDGEDNYSLKSPSSPQQQTIQNDLTQVSSNLISEKVKGRDICKLYGYGQGNIDIRTESHQYYPYQHFFHIVADQCVYCTINNNPDHHEVINNGNSILFEIKHNRDKLIWVKLIFMVLICGGVVCIFIY